MISRFAIDEFVAVSSRWRITLMIVGSAAFVAVGLWMIGAFGAVPSSRRYPAELAIGVGWLSILFFGYCGFSWARRLIDGGEELRIGEAGIRWKPWSGETIPWTEIKDVTVWRNKGNRSIVLHLCNPTRFPGRGFLGHMAKANQLLAGGDIYVSLNSTDRTFEEAMDAIEKFRSSVTT